MRKTKKKKQKAGKIVIGLTGGIATGKKTASSVFASIGAFVINADEIYKDLTEAGSGLNLKIAKEFGRNILNKDLTLDKKILAKIVFKDKNKLARLSSITHPEIIKEIKKRIKAAGAGITVLAAPLLIEAGQTKLVKDIWLITCSQKRQIERVMKRDKVSRAGALLRIRSQMSLKEKSGFADVIIENNGTKKDLKRQILQNLEKRYGFYR
ncbi:MAG: dephospho-CoA kinase [Armatimonadota bacterium]